MTTTTTREASTTRISIGMHSFLFEVNKLLAKSSLEIKPVCTDSITCKVQFDVAVSDLFIDPEEFAITDKVREVVEEAFYLTKGEKNTELNWFSSHGFSIAKKAD